MLGQYAFLPLPKQSSRLSSFSLALGAKYGGSVGKIFFGALCALLLWLSRPLRLLSSQSRPRIVTVRSLCLPIHSPIVATGWPWSTLYSDALPLGSPSSRPSAEASLNGCCPGPQMEPQPQNGRPQPDSVCSSPNRALWRSLTSLQEENNNLKVKLQSLERKSAGERALAAAGGGSSKVRRWASSGDRPQPAASLHRPANTPAAAQPRVPAPALRSS